MYRESGSCGVPNFEVTPLLPAAIQAATSEPRSSSGSFYAITVAPQGGGPRRHSLFTALLPSLLPTTLWDSDLPGLGSGPSPAQAQGLQAWPGFQLGLAFAQARSPGPRPGLFQQINQEINLIFCNSLTHFLWTTRHHSGYWTTSQVLAVKILFFPSNLLPTLTTTSPQ
jgi:hypothetical protein